MGKSYLSLVKNCKFRTNSATAPGKRLGNNGDSAAGLIECSGCIVAIQLSNLVSMQEIV